MGIDRDWKSKAIVYFYFAEVDYSGFWLKFLKRQLFSRHKDKTFFLFFYRNEFSLKFE